MERPSVSAFADTTNVENTKELKTKIEQYVKTIDQSEMVTSATIYTHFLVKEEGFIFAPFNNENPAIIFLNKTFEIYENFIMNLTRKDSKNRGTCVPVSAIIPKKQAEQENSKFILLRKLNNYL